MELDIYAVLEASPVLVLFLMLGFGLLVGNMKIAGVTVGAVSGVLVVGLLFGHIGLAIPTASHDIGFLLFIYCVGVQAGPQFIRVFRDDGSRYACLALLTAASATALAVELGQFFEFEPGLAAGMLAGSLTSTPTLVAAQDAMSTLTSLGSEVSVAEGLENLSSAYAITYVFGLGGLMVFLTLLPRILRIDIVEEARALSEKSGFGISPDQMHLTAPDETPRIRAYRIDRAVPEEFNGVRDDLPGDVQKIKRGDEVFTPDDETRLEVGDVISVIGLQVAHDICRERLGPEVVDNDVLDRSVESSNIVITRSDVAGKTLAEMPFGGGHQMWLTELTRSGVSMPRRLDLELHIGDVLLLTGPRSKLDELATTLGEAESELHHTDLVTLAFGIALGVFVGMVSFKLGATQIGLGSAGGVLLVGLIFGLINSYRPGFGRLPEGARYVLTQLGLLLFMSGIAISAGRDIVETFTKVGPTLALAGVLVTLIPVTLSFALGRYVFKMNAALLLGAISGSMTSTAALQQVSGQSRSMAPMLGYVGTYAFANVLLAVAGGIIVRL
jgi:putative transport protein